MNRRTFLRRSGAATLGLTAASRLPTSLDSIFSGEAAQEEVLYNGILPSNPFPPTLSDFMPTDQVPYYILNPPRPILIDVGRQLFVDDFLIESTFRLKRTYHQATYHPANPLISPVPEDVYTFTDAEGFQVETYLACPYSDGVWWDAYRQRFRAWFMGGNHSLRLAESDDGIQWRRIGASGGPGTVMPVLARRDSGTIWIDYDEPDPEQRYKMAFFCFEDKRNWIFSSADGVTWPTYNDPLVRSVAYSSNPEVPTGDRTTFFYNPFRKKWVWSLRDLTDLSALGGSRLSRVRRYHEADSLVAGARTVSNNTRWLRADAQDAQVFAKDVETDNLIGQLYNVDGVPYESLMIYLLTIRTRPAIVDRTTGESLPKLNQVHLGFSRDGFHITRPSGQARRPFLPVGTPGHWNEGNVQSVGGGCTIVGPETQEQLYFYCSGRQNELLPDGTLRRRGHMGLAVLRRDGFASLQAGRAEGILTTRPLKYHQGEGNLFVNLNTSIGRLQIEVLDEAGQVQDGYEKTACLPIQTDSTKTQVLWNERRNLRLLQGQPFRLRFYIRQGKLFSFWLAPSEAGTGQGYLAAGGPGYSSYRDAQAEALPVGGSVPKLFRLEQNVPNPFQRSTTITYTLETDLRVHLAVYDLLGRNVATLVDAVQPVGRHRVVFEPSGLAGGVYLGRLTTKHGTQTLRMVYLGA